LHRQVSWLRTLEDAIGVARCAAVLFDNVIPIGDQAAVGYVERPPFGELEKAATARISLASLTLIGRTSTPTGGATD